MLTDSYQTIASPSEGEYKEKGSKFLAYAYPMDAESDLDGFMTSLRDIHPKARHYCYAYKLGLDGTRFRANDDGEPSGTAGKPIYGQILSFGLTNVCIIVIRYFGGTKLGASGLIHAYKEASKAALDNAAIIEKYLYISYQLTFGYDHMGHIMNALKDPDIEIITKVFEDHCIVNIQIRLSVENQAIHRLKARLLNKSLEEVTSETVVDFCEMVRKE
ncbi:MAG: YigZ family protein [Saprospiraceae bacterium]|nr:YigZ family protein [Saprospiraceae bacterium]